jgi:predicted HicB family RNase H-like nuclease
VPQKTRKPGRPKLPKGEAMGRIVPVRFAPDDLRAMEAKAMAGKQSLSEWIRSTIHAALNRKQQGTKSN